MVVNDVKFEITLMVVEHRYEMYGKKAYIINLFNLDPYYNTTI
jgi:hypothetical protein